MVEEVIDIIANIERIKEFQEYSSFKLDFNKSKIKIFDDSGLMSVTEFEEGIKILNELMEDRRFKLVADNSLNILCSIPARILDIKDKLDMYFEDLVKIIDVQNQKIEEYQEQHLLDQSIIKEKEFELKTLENQINETKFDTLQQQINILQANILNKNIQNTPDNYFEKPIEETENEEIVEQKKNIPEIQYAHNEVLEIMKKDGFYPLHHQKDLDMIKEQYLETWEFIIPNYPNLEFKDYPAFIDNLSDYVNDSEDILDKV